MYTNVQQPQQRSLRVRTARCAMRRSISSSLWRVRAVPRKEMEREERPRGEEVVSEACCADMEVMEMERISRRAVAGCVCGAVAMMLVSPYRAYAKQGIDFNKRGGSGAKKKAETKYAFRTVPLTDYTRDERTGLLFYDVTEGFGRELSVGDTATVHFDCRFRGIDAVSSRQAALLGGNRTIAQPAVVKVGERPIKGKKGGAGRSDDLLEKSGGLYTGSKGPDPPPALYDMLEGMKVGGRRLVQVEGDEFGFPSGQLEIPPGASFNLEIEVLK